MRRVKNEPAVLVGILAAIVVALAAELDIVIDSASVEAVLLPIVTALVTRFLVSPARP
jgi:hypothetical protein